MKNVEDLTQENEKFVLPKEIKDDLDCIEDILRDNPEFFDKLVKQCMKVGRNYVYDDTITNLLAAEYPDLTTYIDGYLLIQTTDDLTKQLCMHKGAARDQLEYAIGEVFLVGDVL